jgi:hypothetical protein
VTRLLVLVAFLLCWMGMSVAPAHAQADLAADAEAAHAAMHWNQEAHHHHDGGVHQDDSDESIAHVAADHGCCAVALPSLAPSLADVTPDEILTIGVQRSSPTPFLDPLLRPPRA